MNFADFFNELITLLNDRALQLLNNNEPKISITIFLYC